MWGMGKRTRGNRRIISALRGMGWGEILMIRLGYPTTTQPKNHSPTPYLSKTSFPLTANLYF